MKDLRLSHDDYTQCFRVYSNGDIGIYYEYENKDGEAPTREESGALIKEEQIEAVIQYLITVNNAKKKQCTCATKHRWHFAECALSDGKIS